MSETQSDIQPIVMPKWGLAMSEGTLTSWLVTEGAAIKKGDEIAEIESTKIANVFESPLTGTLRRLVAQSGEVLPVGALLGVVAPSEVSDSAIDEFINSFVVEVDADANAGSEDGEVTFNGRPVFFRLSGKDKSGTPIVLIHGFGGDADNWVLNLDALSADRPVYAIDLPGHGRSSKIIEQGDLYELANAVIALLKERQVAKAHLVGHSLGGAVAFAVLGRAPQLVASITGIAPAGLGDTVNYAYIKGFVDAEKRKDVKAALQMLVADPEKVSANMIEGVQRYKRLENVREALTTIASKTMPEGRQTASFRDLAETAQIPIQVIWGEKDILIDPAQAAGLPSKIRVITLASVGHMPHLEAAEAVNNAITAIAQPN